MSAPFEAPPGWRWVFCQEFRHWRSGKILKAVDYDRKCWAFLVRVKRY